MSQGIDHISRGLPSFSPPLSAFTLWLFSGGTKKKLTLFLLEDRPGFLFDTERTGVLLSGRRRQYSKSDYAPLVADCSECGLVLRDRFVRRNISSESAFTHTSAMTFCKGPSIPELRQFRPREEARDRYPTPGARRGEPPKQR